MPAERYAVASCHVERPLDDRCWARFSALQERRPGGFRIAALMRPPDEGAGEDAGVWLERARTAAGRAPVGHHTHFGGPTQARPQGGEEPSERVRRESWWLREHDLEPRLFCGGGWYMDAALAASLAELGYADCTATSFRPGYLEDGAPRLSLDRPSRLRVGGRTLLELPTTHSIGMAARAALGRLSTPVVHVYFHDTDLLDRRRSLALTAALRLLGLRRRVTDLERLADELGPDAPELDFAACT